MIIARCLLSFVRNLLSLIYQFKNSLVFTFKKRVLFVVGIFVLSNLTAQDSVGNKKGFDLRLYLDTYYSFDFTKPSSHQKAAFMYNHNRHNEVSLNLGLIAVAYADEKIRANLGLMAGTYPQYNLAAEPRLLQSVYEANIGLKLSKKHALWVDVGILPSHIGFESAISKDCATLTRSILAENSPYYEAGAKVSYKTNNSKWSFALLLLNGWQRIKRVDGNNTPAFGTQVSFSPNASFSINSSSFIGNDLPDSSKKWRYFHNAFALWQLNKNLGLTLGFDYGVQQQSTGSSKMNQWFSPIVVLKYDVKNWSLATRAEYYDDAFGVIVPLVNTQPFKMQGYSINLDRKIGDKAMWRIEWRQLRNKYPYFEKGNALASSNQYITTSLTVDIRK